MPVGPCACKQSLLPVFSVCKLKGNDLKSPRLHVRRC